VALFSPWHDRWLIIQYPSVVNTMAAKAVLCARLPLLKENNCERGPSKIAVLRSSLIQLAFVVGCGGMSLTQDFIGASTVSMENLPSANSIPQ
jgi:hypothetical protein